MLDSFQVDPVAFTIPIGDGFPIYWYGIIVTLGIAVGAIWAIREIQLRGESADELINGLIIVVIAGYFFARLTYVALDVLGGATYDSFVDVINIRQGGVNILGGFIGAFVVAFFYLRWRKLPIWTYADVTGPTLLLAQSIGRWANYVNQELYGPPTDLPWGIMIAPANRLPQYADLSTFPVDQRFHPTFLYESVWLLLGFFVLWYLCSRFRDKWPTGVIFGLFLIWWGLGRAFIEFFRPDQVTVGDGPITYSMLLALLLAIIGVLVILARTGKLPWGEDARRARRVRKPKPKRTN